MKLSNTSLWVGILTLVVGASPAFAQHHGGGGRAAGTAVSRGGGGHASGPRAAPAAPGGQSRAVAPRMAPSGPRTVPYSGARAVPYSGARAVPYSGARAVPYYGQHGVAVSRGVGVGYRAIHVAPVHFYHPYYAFHPRVSLGFGLWVGYPVAYSYPYYNPFYYGYPYPYPYAPYPYATAPYPGYPTAPSYPPAAYPPQTQGSVGVQPGAQPDQSDTGGLSFEITPTNAQVFIDGAYVGTVGQFTPTSQPLGLVAGRHHVEIRAQGYQTMTFDVDIVAGQVIPYQGTMER